MRKSGLCGNRQLQRAWCCRRLGNGLAALALGCAAAGCGYTRPIPVQNPQALEPATESLSTIALPPTWSPVPLPTRAPTQPAIYPQDQTPSAQIPIATDMAPVFQAVELPSRFVPLSFAALGLSPQIFSRGVGKAEAASAYVDEVNGTVLVSVTSQLNPGEIEAFDRLLGTPRDLLTLIALALGGQATEEAHPISGFPTYGDWTTAISMPITIQDKPWKMELAILRQGTAAGYVLLLIPSGVTPQISLQDAVEQLRPRLSEPLVTAVAP
jgi:hypothetical protein